MKAVIISCKTIENELLSAMKDLNCEYRVLWLESGLHNVPKQLNARLQELLDNCREYDTVLLAMSFCGNSLIGLRTHDFQLVVPRCDDCITLLLGSPERRQEISATYFLTEGWLQGERNIWVEYENCIQKYGEKRGKKIFSVMLANYRNLALLDTGCFDKEKTEAETRKIAQELGLEYTEIKGTLQYIKELLSGCWPEQRFLRIPPNSVVSYDACTLKGGTYGV